MATLAGASAARPSEARFFFFLSCAMALTIVAGFSLNLAMGRSTFAVPLVFHLHATIFFAFIGLFVFQNWLVASGRVAMHRQLGIAGAVLGPVMVVMGVAIIVASLRRNGGPFFFDTNSFLIGNTLQLICFGALLGAALRMRHRPDWHKRLMIGAVTVLTGPGLGRLLPMPLMIPWAWWIAVSATIVFPIAGIIRDRRALGKAHPAWFWLIGAILGCLLLGDAIAYSPVGYAITDAVVAGSPGAERPMKAFLP